MSMRAWKSTECRRRYSPHFNTRRAGNQTFRPVTASPAGNNPNAEPIWFHSPSNIRAANVRATSVDFSTFIARNISSHRVSFITAGSDWETIHGVRWYRSPSQMFKLPIASRIREDSRQVRTWSYTGNRLQTGESATVWLDGLTRMRLRMDFGSRCWQRTCRNCSTLQNAALNLAGSFARGCELQNCSM